MKLYMVELCDQRLAMVEMGVVGLGITVFKAPQRKKQIVQMCEG